MENENKDVEKNKEMGDRQKKHRDILKVCVIVFVAVAVVGFIFRAGMFVGSQRARFSYRWAENYHQNFGGPRGGFTGDWRKMPLAPDNFIESHGIFGEIIKINDADIVVKGLSNTEMIVAVSKGTAIKNGTETIKKEALKISDRVVVIGSPAENGQIAAKLIRIFNAENEINAIPARNNFFNRFFK
ncbi:MAG: hypothetical protein V1661_00125 [bacterium]